MRLQEHKRIVRVFPRHVAEGTPNDGLVRVGDPTLWDQKDPPDCALVSVTFDKDKQKAEQIAQRWSMICNDVQIGGPAYDDKGHDFWPGMFLKRGYTITSRGCPNNCWFCTAWQREGRQIRELPIMPGHNVADNNLLACSSLHVTSVFQMLERQPNKARFTGGLEAKRLQRWHIDWFVRLRPTVMWFAYDTPDDYEPLVVAARTLREAGLMGAKHRSCCYVLAGWGRFGMIDTIEAAEERIRSVVRLGFFPQAMLLNDGHHWANAERREWKDWAAPWIRKRSVGERMKQILGSNSTART